MNVSLSDFRIVDPRKRDSAAEARQKLAPISVDDILLSYDKAEPSFAPVQPAALSGGTAVAVYTLDRGGRRQGRRL